MSNEDTKYFDLYTTGIGYLNRVREVTPKEGSPFWSVTIAALRGSADDAQYSYFECRVSGKQAQEIVRQLKPAVEGKLKVLVGFKLFYRFLNGKTKMKEKVQTLIDGDKTITDPKDRKKNKGKGAEYGKNMLNKEKVQNKEKLLSNKKVQNNGKVLIVKKR